MLGVASVYTNKSIKVGKLWRLGFGVGSKDGEGRPAGQASCYCSIPRTVGTMGGVGARALAGWRAQEGSR